ncbi:beta-N-acetylhexosaminidase [Vibrio maritimus]|uniref:beta-N-acetylhexosaminidase n=1 Tax=Vibrio maritimus TaxID=990268 RepID=UPI001F32B66F|nr:beta-N-acetylhexosaminidase [Vibrio maritimus]
MSNLTLHFEVVNNETQSLKLHIVLENRTDSQLHDFVLCFDMPRFLDKSKVVNGVVKSQVGSHIELTPLEGMRIAAGESWTVTIESNTSGLFNLSERPNGPYLKVGKEFIEVAIGSHSMPQPESLKLNVQPMPAPKAGVIPQPNLVVAKQGTFIWQNSVSMSLANKVSHNAISWLTQQFSDTQFEQTNANPLVSFVESKQLAEEAYQLTISEESVKIEASSSSGFLYGAVTLAQLVVTGRDTVDCVVITDAPQYSYRGQFLDCARSFHDIDTVKSVIDQMVWLKLNTFHWHLTDDEAWRMEIDAYPMLTKLGAWRGEGEIQPPQFGSGSNRYGGFFTKAQIAEVVAYAKAREITVIPEVDIPGHARALIMALPHLLIEKEDTSDYVSIQQYQDNVLNPGLPATYEVLETILDEVCEMFPSEVIHLGGDEVPAHVWEKSPACSQKATELEFEDVRQLEGHLISHLERYIADKGRRIAVWEEASHGNKITNNATVCAWSNSAEGQKAAKAGYPVIMCPAQATYLDMAWNKDINETGVLWAGTIDLKTAYQFEPSNIENSQQVIGTQALVWTEFVKDKQTLEFLLYPRLFAVAEIAWTSTQNKDWSHFLPRVSAQLSYLESKGINYRRG